MYLMKVGGGVVGKLMRESGTWDVPGSSGYFPWAQPLELVFDTQWKRLSQNLVINFSFLFNYIKWKLRITSLSPFTLI